MSANSRLAVVTGSTSGVGKAAAEALLAADWNVVGLARRPAALDDPNYRHLMVDLGATEGLSAFADDHLVPLLHESRWERIGLVNNAAILGSLRATHATTPAELARIFAVNATAPIWLMGFVANEVPPPTSLLIANISSGAAVMGIAGLGDYCASKAALRLAGMAFAAEVELGAVPGRSKRNARVLSYEPGVVDTYMQDLARATDPDKFPSHATFHGFAAKGALHKPEAVVGSIVDFLSASAGETFAELRYG